MKKLIILIVLLCNLLVVKVSAKEIGESTIFKVLVESPEDVEVNNVKIDISISNVIKTDEIGDKQFSNIFYKSYYIKDKKISFSRPSDYFIISIDEKTLPEGYTAKEKVVFIDSNEESYKFIIVEANKALEYNTQKEKIENCFEKKEFEKEENQRSWIQYVTNDRFKIYYNSGITNGNVYASRLHTVLCDVETFYSYYNYPAPDTDLLNHTFDVYISNNMSVLGNYDPSTREMYIRSDLFNETGDEYAFANTVAHEYFHASIRKNGYNIAISSAVEEMCATAAGFYYTNCESIESNKIKGMFKTRMEDFYKDDPDDYFLGGYDEFIIAYHFIEEYGFEFLKKIFPSTLIAYPTFSFIDSVLASEENSSLEEEYTAIVQKNLSVENNYSIDSYYSNDWVISNIQKRPNGHYFNLNDTDFGTVSLDSSQIIFYSLLPHKESTTCNSSYEGYITLVFSSRTDVELYKARVASSGAYQEEVTIPSDYNSSLGGYSYTYFSLNLGLFMCEELNFGIINKSNSTVSISYYLKEVHNIPRVYTGTTYNLGSTVNDIYYLKFVAPFDGFFRFDLNSSLNRYYREELTIKKETINGLETIEKVDNIGVSAYNREGSNNLVAYLDDDDIYYILVRDDADLNYCTLKIWYSFEELEQSPLNVNRYGIWDEVMKKDDYMYSYEIPQDGNYEISFVCFDTGNYNMPYIIYQETGGIFTEIRSILINGNTYYYDSYTVYLESGDVLYIGYFDFRGPSSETCDVVVEKIS